ncbi:MAG: type II toxin-antitoxin system HicB family antitoxin [Planctomycetota bacterium]
MTDKFIYKGYIGVAEIDKEAGLIHGRVLGMRDVVTFEAETVAGLQQAMEDSVEDYLAFCAEKGREPQTSKSGELRLRLGPELHRKVETAATLAGQSMNDYIRGRIERDVDEDLMEG